MLEGDVTHIRFFIVLIHIFLIIDRQISVSLSLIGEVIDCSSQLIRTGRIYVEMNTLSQSTSLAGPMTLTLFKLSFCTTAALRSSLLWTHLPNRDDLFAVFDSTYSRDLEGSITEKKVLKLIRGGGLLVRYSHMLSCTFRQQGYFLLTHDLTLLGLICFADRRTLNLTT